MSKKFFTIATIAAVAVVLVGCQKETAPFEKDSSQLKPIAFTTYTQGATKADVDASNLTSINVLAEYTPTSGSAAKYFNETISLTSNKGESTAYWPLSGKMDFYASNITITDAGVVEVTTTNNDVVVATKTDVTCPGSSDVELAFSHIFAKFVVNAKVATTGLKATITMIDLKRKDPASYNIKTDTWNLSTSDASDDSYLSAQSAAVITATEATNVALIKDYVAPQENVTAKIYYKLTKADDESVVYVDHSTNPAEITGLTFTKGTKTTLNLTIDAAKISFTVSVNDFADGTPSGEDLK